MLLCAKNSEILFNDHNSVIVQNVRTKIGTETINNVQKQSYLHISLLRKSKMAAAAILKIGIMAISLSLWHICERNFTQRLKAVLHKPFYCQN